ncbi:tripartite tricarboxylate transporter permease [Aquibacillus albus]|uniref:Tricarboxylic transport membrane protein n=1 Tax=Aquibacillus albus TaxID=1168171 RepID=A0ABS2N2C1_9BACI|nr:tripartite tricarboxylate transporter permease [Aquibacillus albus]MBM7572289.1 putative tricarboxylic transport membrane protein [Aquibacillus albus]
MEFIFQTFELYHAFLLIFGLLTGILVGALPGLTPTMGVALTIPFTFSLGATEGLIILGGIYCGSVYGGSIPAILFNVPGAPASVATTFDGYPMTEKGEARKALEIATISSVIGGLFGMAMLLFFAPLFADLSLKFGPTESFWVAIFGLTVIAAISEGSTSKNLIGGSIGVMLSFVGIHTITGTTRFTFGMDSLVGGFHVVAVLIGLFAFPQALRIIEKLTSIDKRQPLIYKVKKSSIKQSFVDVLGKPKSVSLGSMVGGFIGLIPGAGGNIASILAYNEVKRFSKNKQFFGKGEKKGVIASESANNAMVGGSLIPLLTLGIPGSPTAAIFLGGLLIHGIWPGRTLFIDNAEVAYTFLYSMIAAQLFLLVLGLSLIKYMTKLSAIPGYIMAPVILSFSIIGAYTMQNNIFDIHTVILIGFIMFFLQKLTFSPAPIALGFILGPIAEEGLLHGVQVGSSHGSALSYFFSGGINIVLFLLIFFTVVVSFIQKIVIHKENSLKQCCVALKWKHLFYPSAIVWLIVAILDIVIIISIQSLPFEQRLFPQITLSILLGLIIIEYMKVIGTNHEQKMKMMPNTIPFKWSMLPILLFVTIVSFLTEVIGFYLQVLLLMMAVPLYFRFVKKNKDIVLPKVFFTAIIFTLILFTVFTLIVKVPLPVPDIF